MAKAKRSRPSPRSSAAFWPAASRSAVSWLPWAVAAIAFVVFLPSLGGEFLNWDDDVNFLANPDYRGLAPENLRWMFSTFLLGHYHPLTWLTLGADYSLWGMAPRGYHLTNVLLHAAVAALVFLLFVELISKARREEKPTASTRWGAALGALLFAVHPLRVESVAWISERRDLLSGLFMVATLLLYVRGRRVASLGFFAAALLSKIIAVTVPVWLLLIDIYPMRRGFTAKTLLEKAPYFALSAAAAWIAVGRYEAGVGGVVADLDLYPALRVMLSLGGVAFYLWKTLWPFGLYPQYVYSADPQPADLPLVFAALAVVALIVAAFLLRRRVPGLAIALGVYAVALSPVLSFVRLDRQQAVNDHHSYLATLGFAALAGGAWSVWEGRSPVRARAVAGAALALLAGLSMYQTGLWRDSRTLWSRTARAQPLSIIAHNNLGRVLEADGDAELALESFQRAVEIQPDYSQAHYNIGLLLARKGEPAEAQAAFERALEREPRNARILTDLGNSLLRLRRVGPAIARYEQAVAIEPGFADARFNLGLALELAGRDSEAREQFRRVTQLEPTNQEAWRRLGE